MANIQGAKAKGKGGKQPHAELRGLLFLECWPPVGHAEGPPAVFLHSAKNAMRPPATSCRSEYRKRICHREVCRQDHIATTAPVEVFGEPPPTLAEEAPLHRFW
mmetsp:Transcript_63508/g.112976  ORF Transcript_63508/g.112976 Transcript_63508/m.112976 type:complete len:104 (-) Transcript_63508:140-451(-)